MCNTTRLMILFTVNLYLATMATHASSGEVLRIPWDDAALANASHKMRTGDKIQFLEPDGRVTMTWTATKEFIAANQHEKAGDFGSAVPLIRELAKSGDYRAQARLAYYYDHALGVEPNPDQVFEWISRSAKQNYVIAIYGVGLTYLDGKGVQRDIKRSIELLTIAAKRGYTTAEYKLGQLARRGYTGSRKDGVTWLTIAAKKNHPDALAELGMMYRDGETVEKDEKHAYALFLRAHETGSTDGALLLGNLYFKGRGVEQDYAEAKRWYESAASRGNPTALTNLGRLYKDGLGVKKSAGDWRRLTESAARMGDVGAASILGYAFEKGDLVPIDHRTAAGWYLIGAQQNDAYCQHRLAQLLQHGAEGLERNPDEALNWEKRAAANGLPAAQRALADSQRTEIDKATSADRDK